MAYPEKVWLEHVRLQEWLLLIQPPLLSARVPILDLAVGALDVRGDVNLLRQNGGTSLDDAHVVPTAEVAEVAPIYRAMRGKGWGRQARYLHLLPIRISNQGTGGGRAYHRVVQQ